MEGTGTGLGHGRAAPERSSSRAPTCRGAWIGAGTGVTQKSGATLEAGGCRSGAGATDVSMFGNRGGPRGLPVGKDLGALMGSSYLEGPWNSGGIGGEPPREKGRS